MWATMRSRAAAASSALDRLEDRPVLQDVVLQPAEFALSADQVSSRKARLAQIAQHLAQPAVSGGLEESSGGRGRSRAPRRRARPTAHPFRLAALPPAARRRCGRAPRTRGAAAGRHPPSAPSPARRRAPPAPSAPRTTRGSRVRRAHHDGTAVGSTSTTPEACSFRRASRTGVRLTPNSAASASCGRRVPRTISPLRTRLDHRRDSVDERGVQRPGSTSPRQPTPGLDPVSN